MSALSANGLIDLDQSILWLSAASIIFNPTFWNLVARSEYKHKTITKLFGGNSLYGCYALGVTITSIGFIRDAIYERAIRAQPSHPMLETGLAQAVAVALFGVGGTFVLTSIWALGFTGTYLGDYFGILQDKMVTGFPFNVVGSPMYTGSTMCFLGSALWYGKPAGIVLSLLTFVVYQVALVFEDPFTANIYAERERNKRTEPQGGRIEPKGGRTEAKGVKTGPKGE